jgi:hypothetical protein
VVGSAQEAAAARLRGAALTRFERFAAIDWSGAKGLRHKGIAVALCEQGDAAPRLVGRERPWSRLEVLDWVLARAGEAPTLFGFDLSASFAFIDRGAYFPGWAESPPDVRALWRLVESYCAHEPDLAASGFVDHEEASRHFRRHGGRCGDLFQPGAGRMRVVEEEERRTGLVNPVSNFNLVGAAQVGKSSLTGMRLLLRLDPHLALWPFDPLPESGSVITEIYTSIAAAAAGVPRGRTKVRDAATLDRALAQLGSRPHRPLARYDDHATDAILTAAWLRSAADRADLWRPAALTSEIALTEGWTFGVP